MNYSTSWPRRYRLLDSCRGVAALAVVFHHTTLFGREWNLGLYGVVAFFVISGYCIAAATESACEKEMGIRAFLWRRVHRIYPPYFFSLIFFVVTRLAKLWPTGDYGVFQRPWTDWIQNFTMTQWVSLLLHPSRDASGNPTLMVAAYWSINYEEQFYIIMALLLWTSQRNKGMLRACTLSLTAILLPYMALSGGWCYGLFGLGVLVYFRLCSFEKAWQRRTVDGIILILTLITGGLCWLQRHQGDPNLILGAIPSSRLMELLLAEVFSLVLIGLRSWDTTFDALWFSPLTKYLGMISYSLYLVHQFNLVLVQSATRLAFPQGTPVWVTIGPTLFLHISIASVFWYFCERPFLNTAPTIAPVKRGSATVQRGAVVAGTCPSTKT